MTARALKLNIEPTLELSCRGSNMSEQIQIYKSIQ